MISSLRQTKLQYRLLADGTILDQKTGKTAGYISGQSNLDELWSMNGRQRQKRIVQYLEAGNGRS